MQPRILLTAALSLFCSLFVPIARAHGGGHGGLGPVEWFMHMRDSADHWLAVPLLLVCALALFHLLKVRSRP